MSDIKVQPVKREPDRTLPVFAEFDEVLAHIRQRAFELFQQNGFRHGRALDHWLTAEREICWPAAKLSEQRKSYRLEVALAGFRKNDISVTASPNELLIRAEQKSTRQGGNDASVRWSEFKGNRVYRRVVLPQTINVDKVRVRFKNGMLKIKAKKSKNENGKRAHRKKPR